LYSAGFTKTTCKFLELTLFLDGNVAVEAVKQSMESGKKFDLIFMDIQVGCSPYLASSQ